MFAVPPLVTTPVDGRLAVRRTSSLASPQDPPAAAPESPQPSAGPAGALPHPQAVPRPDPAVIPLGEATRRHLARVLEQAQAPLLLAVLEASGQDVGSRWQLVITAAVLAPAPEGPP